MMKRIALIGCLALLGGQAACKKESKKSEKTETDTTAGKTTEPTETPPPQPEKAKLDTPEDKVAFLKTCNGYLNGKDFDKLGTCYTDNVTFEHVDSAMPPTSGKQAVLDNLKNMATAFPDFAITPTMMFVNGNKIAEVGVYTATNSGAMKGPQGEMPATNKKVGVLFFHKLAFNDENKATESWEYMDMTSFMGQLGQLPKGVPYRPAIEKGWAGAPIIVVAADDAKEKANLEIVKKSNDAFNTHKIPDALAFWADDGLESDQAGDKDQKGKKELEAGLKMFLTAFPDVKVEVPNLYAAGDYVVALGTFSGTNTGPMGKMKKTDKKVTGNFAEVIKIKDNKVSEIWRFRNGYAMAVQMGLAPPPGAAPAGAPPAGTEPAKKDDKKAAEPAKAPEPTK